MTSEECEFRDVVINVTQSLQDIEAIKSMGAMATDLVDQAESAAERLLGIVTRKVRKRTQRINLRTAKSKRPLGLKGCA